jgi:hypothetical protein
MQGRERGAVAAGTRQLCSDNEKISPNVSKGGNHNYNTSKRETVSCWAIGRSGGETEKRTQQTNTENEERLQKSRTLRIGIEEPWAEFKSLSSSVEQKARDNHLADCNNRVP